MALVCIGTPKKFLLILLESRSMGSIIWPVRVECKQTENKLLSPRRCYPGVGWVFLFRIIKNTPCRRDQRPCELIPGIVVKLTTKIRKEACPFSFYL